MSGTRFTGAARARFGNLLAGAALLAIVLLLLAWQAPGAAPVTIAADPQRRHAAVLALLLYAGFCAWLWWRCRPAASPASTAAGDAGALQIVHASQTGRAQQLAQQTAESLRSAGVATRLVALPEFTLPVTATRALFIVSTTGEGDAPDHCHRFVQQMAQRAELGVLRYGLLALGDRSYRNFCAFGRDLDQWLQHCGAQPLFDRVEVDGSDAGALRHWQQQLRTLAGEHAEFADWTPPIYQNWQLLERELLNAGSLGQPVYRIALRPPVPAEGMDLDWRAGDIAEIGPRNDPAEVDALLAVLGLDPQQTVDGETLREQLAARRLPRGTAREALRGLSAAALPGGLEALPHREYSIASLPQDGRLELLVRLMRHGDGQLGHGSGWLCQWAPPGATIALRVRRNAGFHLDAGTPAPLLLIGNGTGIAGLRAHWRARIAAGQTRNWLLFGERQRARDFHFGNEIDAALQAGQLARVDVVFSRDGDEHRYVQDRLRVLAADVRNLVADGGHVLVCGSLQGMAPAVDQVLREVLGDSGYERLLAEGRYRRDVY